MSKHALLPLTCCLCLVRLEQVRESLQSAHTEKMKGLQQRLAEEDKKFQGSITAAETALDNEKVCL